jgi:poly(3-hydroxybutyrate) depolymerase
MLYQIYETQRSLMEPFADFAQAASKLYSNPLSPFGQNPFAQRVSAGYDLVYRLGKDYEKPEFGIKTVDVDGIEVAIHERVEIDKPFCELRRFKRFSDDPGHPQQAQGQPAVLVVARCRATMPPCCATRCAPCSRTTRSTSPTGRTPAPSR